eukprot:2007490-Rhodomonas_salina.1
MISPCPSNPALHMGVFALVAAYAQLLPECVGSSTRVRRRISGECTGCEGRGRSCGGRKGGTWDHPGSTIPQKSHVRCPRDPLPRDLLARLGQRRASTREIATLSQYRAPRREPIARYCLRTPDMAQQARRPTEPYATSVPGVA